MLHFHISLQTPPLLRLPTGVASQTSNEGGFQDLKRINMSQGGTLEFDPSSYSYEANKTLHKLEALSQMVRLVPL